MPRRNYLKEYPKIMVDWSYYLNGDVNINEIDLKSVKKYFWKCHKERCGKVWKDTLYGRIVLGRGCPKCGERAKKRSTLDTLGINKEFEKIEKYISEIEKKIDIIKDSEVSNTRRVRECSYVLKRLNSMLDINLNIRDLVIQHKKNEKEKGKSGINDNKG